MKEAGDATACVPVRGHWSQCVFGGARRLLALLLPDQHIIEQRSRGATVDRLSQTLGDAARVVRIVEEKGALGRATARGHVQWT